MKEAWRLIRQGISDLNKALTKPVKSLIVAVILLTLFVLALLCCIIWWQHQDKRKQDRRVEFLEKKLDDKDGIIDQKNTFILNVLIGINARANALFDSSEAQNRRR